MVFKFTEENLDKAREIIRKYPEENSRSAVMPLLWLAQEQNNNYISDSVIQYLSEFLSIPKVKIYEIVKFYTMYNSKPVGKNLVQVCRTLSCMLRGAEELTDFCKKKFNVELGETSDDKNFTLVEVECLGACVNAPVVQINNDYYENCTTDSLSNILSNLNN